MKTLYSPLIANIQTRQLSALGYKQMYRIIEKAAQANNTHRFSKEFKPMKEQITKLVTSLIFDHNITKEQLSQFQKDIKVTNNISQLPSIATYSY